MGSMLKYGCMKLQEKSLRRGFDSRQLHHKDCYEMVLYTAVFSSTFKLFLLDSAT